MVDAALLFRLMEPQLAHLELCPQVVGRVHDVT